MCSGKSQNIIAWRVSDRVVSLSYCSLCSFPHLQTHNWHYVSRCGCWYQTTEMISKWNLQGHLSPGHGTGDSDARCLDTLRLGRNPWTWDLFLLGTEGFCLAAAAGSRVKLKHLEQTSCKDTKVTKATGQSNESQCATVMKWLSLWCNILFAIHLLSTFLAAEAAHFVFANGNIRDHSNSDLKANSKQMEGTTGNLEHRGIPHVIFCRQWVFQRVFSSPFWHSADERKKKKKAEGQFYWALFPAKSFPSLGGEDVSNDCKR